MKLSVDKNKEKRVCVCTCSVVVTFNFVLAVAMVALGILLIENRREGTVENVAGGVSLVGRAAIAVTRRYAIHYYHCSQVGCLNGARCVNENGQYTCQCPPGFEGERCETNVDECSDSPCLNGGTCVDGVNGHTCQCEQGFEGSNCQNVTDHCLISPCQNGKCVNHRDGYTCDCDSGYEGEFCETESEMEGQPHTPVRIQTSRPNSRNTMIECETCKVWFDSMDRYSKHPCVQAEPKATTSTADTETGILNWTWTKESTLLLIDEYKKRMELLNTGKMKKKSAWISISKILVDKGYNVTASQCEGRWKTLLRGLKTISDHNKKSGNDKKSHPFAKELEFMAEKPNIKPEYVAGSDETSKTKRSFNTETASTDDDSDQLHPKASTSGENTDQSDVKTSNEPKSKRRKSSSAEVVTVLKDFIQTQQERYEIESKKKEQMHNERMEIFKGFLNVLQRQSDNKNE